MGLTQKMCVLAISCMLLMATSVSAETFDVSVDIQESDAAEFIVWQLVDGEAFPDDPFSTGSSSLVYTVTLTDVGGGDKVFLGDHYYAIDVSPNGIGQLNVLIEYEDLQNSNGTPGDETGLEIKGIATVVKAMADESELVLEREVLRDIDNTTVLASTLETFPSGFMRMYVGLATGDPDADPSEPADAVPFTPADAAGPYAGQITLTASQP